MEQEVHPLCSHSHSMGNNLTLIPHAKLTTADVTAVNKQTLCVASIFRNGLNEKCHPVSTVVNENTLL